MYMGIKSLKEGNLITLNGKIFKIIKKIFEGNINNDLCNIKLLSKDGPLYFHGWDEDLEPILLKEHLLEKIGFKNVGNTFKLNLDKYEITVSIDYTNCYTDITHLIVCDDSNEIILEATVKYIHTLQNIIFGITGVELNVDKLIKNKYYEN